MKFLTDKEMVLIGVLGGYLEDIPALYDVMSGVIAGRGYRPELLKFADSLENMVDGEDYFNSLVVEIMMDILKEVG